MKKLCVIGCGVMGQAMLRGILGSGFAPKDIVATTRSRESLERVREALGVDVTLDNRAAASEAGTVLVAVKPQALEAAAGEFRDALQPGALVISVAAGKTLRTLEGLFGEGRKIIRAMPNIQALALEGMSVLCGNGNVNSEDLDRALALFRTFGRAEEIPERLMDAAMAVTSCSPAYVALFVEALSDAGVKLGLTRRQALSMAAQAVCGAAKLLLSEGLHPAILKDQVCSPGGTTIAAIAALEEHGFRGAVIQAVEAAARRAGEL